MLAALSGCRTGLLAAAQDSQWDQVASIDREILEVVKSLTPSQREGVLAQELKQLRAAYQKVMSISEARRELLQKKMQGLRKNRQAMKGYRTSETPGVQGIKVQV